MAMCCPKCSEEIPVETITAQYAETGKRFVHHGCLGSESARLLACIDLAERKLERASLALSNIMHNDQGEHGQWAATALAEVEAMK